MKDVFSVPIFFIVFRETLETSIIVSILLAFVKQTLSPEHDDKLQKQLTRQVWYGTGVGLFCCLAVGGGLVGSFYGLHKDHWASTEPIWEGVFSLIASVIITVVGAAMLRVSKLQAKWRLKIAQSMALRDSTQRLTFMQRLKIGSKKYPMFYIPFITVLREGLEAFIFVAGVGASYPGTSIPLAAIIGLLAGCVVGFIIYKGGNFASLQWFLIVSTCFLYLIAAGLLSRGVWYLESNKWNSVIGGDAAETGSGPGSYDIRQSVWHVNCCNPELNGGGGWGIFNAILGWQNSATVGSVVSYNLYWLVVIIAFLAMGYNEKTGHWPLMKAKAEPAEITERKNSAGDTSESDTEIQHAKKVDGSNGGFMTKVRSVSS